MSSPKIMDGDGVRWITLCRPDCANALRIEDLATMAGAVRSLGEEVRAVVFVSTGDRVFSSGMHLDTFRGATPESARQLISQVTDFLRAVRTCPVPTVIELNGTCVGAALELALACDVRIAQPEVRVGLPEVKLGIPSVADASLLPHFVGLSRARELILTGDLYGLGEMGPAFANVVANPAELRGKTLEMVARLTAPTRQVLAAQKVLFETWLNQGVTEGAAVSVDVFAELFEDPATTAAVEAYRPS